MQVVVHVVPMLNWAVHDTSTLTQRNLNLIIFQQYWMFFSLLEGSSMIAFYLQLLIGCILSLKQFVSFHSKENHWLIRTQSNWIFGGYFWRETNIAARTKSW